MSSILEQYRISDFLEWHREKRLELNPDFQRGSVWTPAARTFLIDTILRQLPIPKVYLRTRIDVSTKKSIRELVDGQQRLRAILDFAEDKFTLSKRAGGFAGKRYSTLSESEQETFLSYPIAVDQLVNASLDDVLEVFARLNSYTVTLNPPEKRHAKFQGDFKWAVRTSSRRWSVLWDQYKLLTVRERVRMLDDSLTAEMFGVLMEGIIDGGQAKIDALYRRHDASFQANGEAEQLDKVLQFLVDNLAESLAATPIFSPPHFLMLFSALALILIGIPQGELKQRIGPPQDALTDLDRARENLLLLASIIDSADEPPAPYTDFWKASRSTTQRIASRRIRFPFYVRALGPQPL